MRCNAAVSAASPSTVPVRAARHSQPAPGGETPPKPAGGTPALRKLPNEAMRSARRFELPSSTVKVPDSASSASPRERKLPNEPILGIRAAKPEEDWFIASPLEPAACDDCTKRTHYAEWIPCRFRPSPRPLPSDGRGREILDHAIPGRRWRFALGYYRSSFQDCRASSGNYQTNPFRPSLPSPRRGKPVRIRKIRPDPAFENVLRNEAMRDAPVPDSAHSAPPREMKITKRTQFFSR